MDVIETLDLNPFESLSSSTSDEQLRKELHSAEENLKSLLAFHQEEEQRQEEAAKIDEETDSSARDKPTDVPGRLGPSCPVFDIESSKGKCKFYSHLLIEGDCNFYSARANVCVYEGRWMYEVTLLTAGVQQIGWVTRDCPFTHEEGVGDAPDSFAFDGKRKKKWNVAASNYGEYWNAGDVIGVCIDLDKGEISYYRNGRALGMAFDGLRIGCRGVAYFPAISLAHQERCRINFGASKFVYNVDSFQPLHLQKPKLNTIICNLTENLCVLDDYDKNTLYSLPTLEERKRSKLSYDIIINNLFQSLSTSITQATLGHSILPFFYSCFKKYNNDNIKVKQKVLWYLNNFALHLDDFAFEILIDSCIEFFAVSVQCVSFYNLSIQGLDQEEDDLDINVFSSLRLFEIVTEAPKLKEIFLNSEVYCISLEAIFSLRTLNNEDMAILGTNIWLPDIVCEDQFDSEEDYQKWVRSLSAYQQKIEDLQAKILKKMIKNEPENIAYVVFKEWLTGVVRNCCDKYFDNSTDTPITESALMDNLFFLILRCMDDEECGKQAGSAEIFDSECINALGYSFINEPTVVEFHRLRGSLQYLQKDANPNAGVNDEYSLPDDEENKNIQKVTKEEQSEILEGLSERSMKTSYLFDTCVLLFHLSLSRRYKHHWNCLEHLASSSKQLTVADKQVQKLQSEGKIPGAFLLKSRNVFLSDMRHFFRQKMWNDSIYYGKGRQKNINNFVYALVTSLTRLAKENSFPFIPEHYLSVFLDSFWALKSTYALTIEHHLKPTAEAILTFLVKHFGDSRICNPDTKELMLQNLCKLMKSEDCLTIVEASPSLQTLLMRNLLLAFDCRFWIVVSSSIIKFWTGKTRGGFEFESDELEIRPSPIMQARYRELAVNKDESVSTFLNCLFNQGSWAITELYVVLQEIQNVALMQSENESDTLIKKSTIMAELTVNLLHLLEIAAEESTVLFSEDTTKGRILTTRMLELVFHVIRRVGQSSDIDEYNENPILRPLLSALVKLYKGIGDPFLQNLIKNPGFVMDNIEMVLSKLENSNKEGGGDVSDAEIAEYKEFVETIKAAVLKQNTATEVEEIEGELCNICYTFVIDRIFEPCKHTSCDQCISRHLLNDPCCFFCKEKVVNVREILPGDINSE